MTPDHPGPPAPEPCFGVEHLEDVLEGQRLEVQPVGGVVVGGHRLRVAVDHHGLETGLAQRGCRVHAAVVEFDALADPVRSGAQDQHLGLLGLRCHLGLGGGVEFVAAVVVRRLGLELRGAGVDGLVHRVDAESLAQRAHPVLAGQFRSQRGDLAIRQAVVLAAAQQVLVEHRGVQQLGRAAPPARRSASTNHGSTPEACARPAPPTRPGAAPVRCRRAGRRSGSAAAPARPRRRPRDRAASRSRPGWSPASASPCRAPR